MESMKPACRDAARDPARGHATAKELPLGQDAVLSGCDLSEELIGDGFLPHTGNKSSIDNVAPYPAHPRPLTQPLCALRCRQRFGRLTPDP
jgi:hypothetical protein